MISQAEQGGPKASSTCKVMAAAPNSLLSQIRPHRFGGEGVLIGVQTATLQVNAQSHLLI